MNQKVLNKVFVWGFLFLYLLVACISFCHAVEFFNIGNANWMSITLAFAFELGLALSLAAILLSDSNSKNVLPWALMIILCAVQVIGNVYSTYKYIALSETEYYQYLAQPLLFWIEEISEDTVRIIISWIIGAILPIIALFMTDMVASNLKTMNDYETKDTAKKLNDEPAILAASPAPIDTVEPVIKGDAMVETKLKPEDKKIANLEKVGEIDDKNGLDEEVEDKKEKDEKRGVDLEEIEEEDVDVPTLKKKSTNKILSGVKSLFNKPRPQEIKEEDTVDDTAINQPNTGKFSYNASPSYFKSPESESHK